MFMHKGSAISQEQKKLTETPHKKRARGLKSIVDQDRFVYDAPSKLSNINLLALGYHKELVNSMSRKNKRITSKVYIEASFLTNASYLVS